jgi:hypothetical protein
VADYKNLFPTLAGAKPAAPALPTDFGTQSGLALGSFVNSWPELIGLEGWNKEQVDAWRLQNPGTNLATQLAGLLVPYAGWAKAGSMALKAPGALKSSVPFLPGAAKLFQGWEAGKKTAPIANAIKQDLALTIPFELARLGAVGVNKPESLTEEAGNSALGLGLLPAFHGGVGLLRAAAPWSSAASKVQKALPEFPVKAPIQDQLRYIYENLPKAGADAQPWLQAQATSLERQVLGQQPRGAKYVTALSGGGDAGDVNRLFQMKADSGLSRKQFIVSPTTGFGSRAEADALLKSLGLPEGWGADVQFPRHITALEASNARAVQKTLSKNLQPVQNSWYVGQEDKSGLYVLARKLTGDPAKAGAGDTWTVLKTAEPNKILGRDVISMAAERNVTFANGLQRQRELAGLAEMPEDSLARLVANAKETFKPAVLGAGKGADAVLGAAPGVGKSALAAIKAGTQQERAALGSMAGFVRDKVVPAQAEFWGKPLAEHVRLVAQAASDAAGAKVRKLMYGEQGLKAGQNVYSRIAQTDKPGGIASLIEKLEPEDLPLLTAMRNAEVPLEKMAEALAGLGAVPKQLERVLEFFQHMATKIDGPVTKEIQQAEKLYGLDNFEPRDNHYGLPHTWRGTWRQRVLDEKGNTISMGAGRSRAEAVRAAQGQAERLGARADDKGPFQSDREQDAKLANMLFKREKTALDARARALGVEPYTFRLRTGVGGFIGEEEALTKSELHEIVESNLKSKYQYLAEQAIKNQVMPDLMDVYSKYGMKTFKALAYRINQMFGVKGSLNKAQNEAMDKVLAPILGKNSADKITRAANQAEMFLNLLAYNLSHPIMNALTFVQTVMPKAAFVMGAGPDAMQKVMGYQPAFTNGRVTGISGVFEPLKLAVRSFRDMAKPDQELRSVFNRAAEEGVITSGLQEQYVGEKSSVGKWISNSMSETNPTRKMLENLDSSPLLNPSKKTEELSRAHALVVGRNLARSMGMEDPDQVYQFAKQFTYRTMYQYNTADRPKAFNGPLGSMFGLFKNWAFHYMSDMAMYGGAAAKREQFAPMLWALGGQASLAGAGGTLGYGVADAASKMFTNQGLMDNLYAQFDPDNKDTADTIFYGLPALLGISLQANAGSPFANPAKDIAYLTNFAVVDRAKKIGAAAGYFGGQLAAGQNPLTNEQTWDKMAYALAPRTLYKALGMIEDGALKAASNGQPIISGITTPEWAANSFGLTPLQITKAWELNDRLFTEKDRLSTLVGSLGEAFYQAQLRGDSGVMEEVLRTALLQGAPIPNVMASVRAKLRANAEPSLASGLSGNPAVAAQAANLGFGQ